MPRLPRLPPYSLTIAASAVLIVCGVFGWGEPLRARAGDLLHWGDGGRGSTCTVPGFPSDEGPAPAKFMREVRRRVDARLPIYVARGEPLSEPLVSLRGHETLLGDAPGGDGPIDPALIAVEAVPPDLGCLFLIIATVYDESGGFLDEAGPVYELRPSPGVRVQVYAPGLAPGALSNDVRAWSRTHLVPYQG